MRTTLITALIATAGLLVGCFGGGGDDTAPPDTTASGGVPASALASGQAFVQFLRGLGSDDSAQPLSLDGAEPPLADTEEPADAG